LRKVIKNAAPEAKEKMSYLSVIQKNIENNFRMMYSRYISIYFQQGAMNAGEHLDALPPQRASSVTDQTRSVFVFFRGSEK